MCPNIDKFLSSSPENRYQTTLKNNHTYYVWATFYMATLGLVAHAMCEDQTMPTMKWLRRLWYPLSIWIGRTESPEKDHIRLGKNSFYYISGDMHVWYDCDQTIRQNDSKLCLLLQKLIYQSSASLKQGKKMAWTLSRSTLPSKWLISFLE